MNMFKCRDSIMSNHVKNKWKSHFEWKLRIKCLRKSFSELFPKGEPYVHIRYISWFFDNCPLKVGRVFHTKGDQFKRFNWINFEFRFRNYICSNRWITDLMTAKYQYSCIPNGIFFLPLYDNTIQPTSCCSIVKIKIPLLLLLFEIICKLFAVCFSIHAKTSLFCVYMKHFVCCSHNFESIIYIYRYLWIKCH